MVITTRLQEVERRKQCKKRKRKKPYQQQLHKDRVFLFSFFVYLHQTIESAYQPYYFKQLVTDDWELQTFF
jgi:hypothetical protein